MGSNNTSQNIIRDRQAYLDSIKLFIEIMQTYLKVWNLDYKTLRNVRTPDDKRIIFDVLTTNKDTGQNYTVHVDTIHSKCTVEQFLDCQYGTGSTSDRKVIIYKGDDTKQEVNKLSPEEYFVSLLAERCDDIEMPFSVIKHSYFPGEEVTMYGPPLADRGDYPEFIMEEPSDPSSMNLPTKWDIQRMAFWALYFNTHLPDKYYHLNDLHCSESPEFKISDDLSILVRWTEDGICYVVSDSLQSAFFPWLWENRKTYLERYYSAYSISTY